MNKTSRKSRTLLFFLTLMFPFGALAACTPDKKAEDAASPAREVLVMFRSAADRERIQKMENPKFPLAAARSRGDKILLVDLPSASFAGFKTWMEGQEGVVVVEDNARVGAMTTP